MLYSIQIENIQLKDQLSNSWSRQDYIDLLAQFDFPNAEGTTEELLELLHLAISDVEPNEAAEILLNYRLSGTLSEGQIQQLSHEMLEDKVAEEYPDIALHKDLFQINQLLYKAYNGKFPLCKASYTTLVLEEKQQTEAKTVTKEFMLKALASGLAENSVLKRLFEEQLKGEIPFPEAESILWECTALGDNRYQLVTSEYWLDKNDFTSNEFITEVTTMATNEVVAQ